MWVSVCAQYTNGLRLILDKVVHKNTVQYEIVKSFSVNTLCRTFRVFRLSDVVVKRKKETTLFPVKPVRGLLSHLSLAVAGSCGID